MGDEHDQDSDQARREELHARWRAKKRAAGEAPEGAEPEAEPVGPRVVMELEFPEHSYEEQAKRVEEELELVGDLETLLNEKKDALEELDRIHSKLAEVYVQLADMLSSNTPKRQ